MQYTIKLLAWCKGQGVSALDGSSAGKINYRSTPLEAITCATRNGAQLMRMADRIGTLEPGKLADLLVLEDDPLKDIRVLQDRERISVMKGGEFVTRRFAPVVGEQ